MLKAVAVYVFAGGFTVGVKHAGFDVLCHLEGKPPYGGRTVRANWPDLPIHAGYDSWPLEALKAEGIDFVYCNPPCAPWSNWGGVSAGGKNAWRTDPRVECWQQSFSVLEKVRPRVWACESVTNVYTHGRDMIDDYTRKALMMGYSVSHVHVDAKWFGIPQSRRRFFMVCHLPSRLSGWQLNWAPPPTIGQTLAEVSEVGFYLEDDKEDVLDLARRTPPGGRFTETFNKLHAGKELKRNAQGKVTGRPSFQYSRLDPDKIMGAWISDHAFHPTEIRHVSFNEGKAICGFPPEFQLAPEDLRYYGSLLARGVMPPVGAWLGRVVKETLLGNHQQWDGTQPQWLDRTVTHYDLRQPGIEPVDLTREYLSESGKVRVRVKAVSQGREVNLVTFDEAAPIPAEAPRVEVVGESQPEPAPPPKPVARSLPPALPSGPLSEDEKPLAGEGSGVFIRRLWMTGKYSPEELLTLVHASYPGRKTGISDISWNYHRLLKDGVLNVPPWPSKKTRTKTVLAVDPAVPISAVLATVGEAVIKIDELETRVDSADDIAAALMKNLQLAPGERVEQPAAGLRKGFAPAPIHPRYEGTVKRLLLYFSKLADRDVTAPVSSARMAWFLEDELQPDEIWHEGDYRTDVLPEVIEELWVVNSSWFWMCNEFRRVCMRLHKRAKRIIWCGNDYALFNHGYFVGVCDPAVNYITLSTCAGTEKQPAELVNWNVLTYQPRLIDDWLRKPAIYYYGSMRAGRKQVFDKYFTNPPSILTVSASKGSDERKFREAYPLLNVVPKADDVVDELTRWEATLILEDVKATQRYVSPPNRFYEALSAEAVMIFDKSSIPLFNQYGYDIIPFVVNGPDDLQQMIHNVTRMEQCRAEQRFWHRDYIKELRTRLHELLPLISLGRLGQIGAPYSGAGYKLIEDGGEW